MSAHLEQIAAAVDAGARELWPKLLRTAAAEVRSRMDAGDAAIVAGWLDRLASGDNPNKVFPAATLPGRPRKASQPGPDDFDVAWLVRQAIDAGYKAAEAKRRVARALCMGKRNVSNIYSRLQDQLGPPPA